jgi:glycerophosphoryl diester phosphodiesterase
MPSSRSRQAELARLAERPFAHRGLHGGGRIENSRTAFEAAIDAGFGIELDVQAAEHGFACVFHDEALERLTDEQGFLRDRDIEDLKEIRLRGSRETLRELLDILALIAARVPLLIEVKARGPAFHQLCYHVAQSLRLYRGPVGVMSFDPRVPRWFARHYPHVLRGLVVTESGKRGWRGTIERTLASAWGRPDFLAYDIRDLPSRFAAAHRARGVPVFTWTVRSDEERARAAAHADQIIFELPA